MASGTTEGWLKKTLEEKGVREDVISDVLKEMKVEGQRVLSGKTDSKPQGKVGAQSYEGPTDTFLGQYAGYIITGSYDTFIGAYAEAYNTSGHDNTFLGYSAGYSNTTGRNNRKVDIYRYGWQMKLSKWPEE